MYEIDYLQLCMLSKYRTAYTWGERYSPTIFWTSFGLQLVSTAIAILAGYAGAACAFKAGMLKTYEPPSVGKFVVDLIEEQWWENVVSATLQFCGVAEGIADQIGEWIGLDTVVGKLSGDSSKVQTEARQILQQCMLGTHVITQSQTTGVTLTTNTGKVSLWLRLKAAYVASRAAKIIDATTLMRMVSALRHSEMTLTQGDTRNVQQRIQVFQNVLGLELQEFTLSRPALQAYRRFIQQQLLMAVMQDTDGTQLMEILTHPQNWLQAQLGSTKSQHFEFLRKATRTQPELRFILNADRSALVWEGGVCTKSYTADEAQTYLSQFSIGEFLAQFSDLRLVDPGIRMKIITNRELEVRRQKAQEIRRYFLNNRLSLISRYNNFHNNPNLRRSLQKEGINMVAYAKINQISRMKEIITNQIGQEAFYEEYGDLENELMGGNYLIGLKGVNHNPDGTVPFIMDEINDLITQMTRNRITPPEEIIDNIFRFKYILFDVNARYSDAETKIIVLLYKFILDNNDILHENGIRSLDIDLYSEGEFCPNCWSIMNQFISKCMLLGIDVHLEISFSDHIQEYHTERVQRYYNPPKIWL